MNLSRRSLSIILPINFIRLEDPFERLFRFCSWLDSNLFFSALHSSINSVLVIPLDPTSYRRDYRLLNPPANAFDDSLIAIVDRWQRQATVSWQRNANRLISTARSGRATLMWRDQIDLWLIVTHGYDRELIICDEVLSRASLLHFRRREGEGFVSWFPVYLIQPVPRLFFPDNGYL